MHPVTQQLLDHQLLSPEDTGAFETLFEQSEHRPERACLEALYQIYFKKDTGRYPFDFTAPMVGTVTLLPPRVLSANHTRFSQYLSGLRAAGLIPESLFLDCQLKVDQHAFVVLFQVLHHLVQGAAYRDYMHPDRLRAFANALRETGMVGAKYEALLADIAQDKLEQPLDFLRYCEAATIIRMQDYPNDPAIYLEAIHRQTASLLPELSFTGFAVQITPDNTLLREGIESYDFVVSLETGQATYQQRSFFQMSSPNIAPSGAPVIDQSVYHKIFNKILADVGSSYRLHSVDAHLRNKVEPGVFGIIALHAAQARFLKRDPEALFRTNSFESFDSQWNNRIMQETIEVFERIGLFSHLHPEQVAQARQNLAEQNPRDAFQVLLAFPEVALLIHAELTNVDTPYAAFVQNYRSISHYELDATDISDDFDIENAATATLEFRIADRIYRTAFQISNDWIDSTFFAFMRSVAAENNLKGQFYTLLTEEEGIGIIYLTKAQYDFLKRRRILRFDEAGL